MIATVRIAPVERWCAASKQLAMKRPQPNPEIGMEIEILTETMRKNGSDANCDGAYWDMTNKSANELMQRLGEPPVFGVILTICEHQLEMD